MRGHNFPHTKETIEKIKIARKKQGSPWNFGRKRPDVAKRMKFLMTGKKMSKKNKEKLKIANTGRKVTDETKLKIGFANRGEKSGMWKGGKPKCECGKIIKYSSKYCVSCKQKGERNHFWKGGLTKKNYHFRVSIMNSPEYKLWRKSVFERDNYNCIWCGKNGGELNADHIKSFSQFPELRFAIDNGRTLCKDCHKKTDTYGIKLKSKRPLL